MKELSSPRVETQRPKNLVLKALLTIKNRERKKVPKPIKLLVEGGYMDSWSTHDLLSTQAIIPENCNNIRFAQAGKSEFTLVALWRQGGIEWLENQTSEGEVVDLTSAIGSTTLRPCTVITEDGRIYHDLSLLNSAERGNRKRLLHFLITLANKYDFDSKKVAKLLSEGPEL